MILRKPYAFLIKHFKLIHLIMLIFMTILLYRTNIVLNFFQEYIASTQMLTGKDFTGELFRFYMFLLPFLLVSTSIVLLAVMYYKKKPVFYYVLHIIIYIAVLIVYNIAFGTAGTLETHVMDIRNVRIVRDLLIMILAVQALTVLLTFIRATGFDIKKFNFGQDLQELEIEEEDNEEFEVDVDIETNVIHRGINKQLRFAKYIYVENRFLINILILLGLSTVCFIIYMNLGIYNKAYNQNEMFMATDFTLEVSNSYITNKNYHGEKITDKYLVLVELNLRSNYSEQQKINTAKTELIIDGKTYYHTNIHRSNLFDVGHVYDYNTIPIDFTKEILVYEIPTSEKNKKMTFRYIDTIDIVKDKLNPKYIKVSLNPFNLDKEVENKKIDINSSVMLNETIFGSTSLMIQEFKINKEFIANYRFCATKDECYNAKEYLKPTLNTNYDKTLLRITGTLNLDKEAKKQNIYDMFSIIKYFGTITYEIDGTTKKQNLGFRNVKPTRTEDAGNTYIEMIKELEKADNIKLTIQIRNKSYEYTIKEL